MADPLTILTLAVLVALLHGIGSAVQKNGITLILARLATEGHPGGLLAGGVRPLALAILRTPRFLVGAFLAMILSGGLLMVLLSMGDGAKTGIFVGALTSVVCVIAHNRVNGERLGALHAAGICVALLGSAILASGGLRA